MPGTGESILFQSAMFFGASGRITLKILLARMTAGMSEKARKSKTLYRMSNGISESPVGFLSSESVEPDTIIASQSGESQ